MSEENFSFVSQFVVYFILIAFLRSIFFLVMVNRLIFLFLSASYKMCISGLPECCYVMGISEMAEIIILVAIRQIETALASV